MTTRRIAAAMGIAVTALAASMVAAAPASAEITAGEHCTVNANTGEKMCFGDFAEAVDHASQGRVADAPRDLRSALGSSALHNRLAADSQRAEGGDVIQGTVFDNRDYGGDSLTIWGTAPCKKDGVVNFQIDLEDGWKNRISSVQPWANCWLWLYPEANLGGERDGPFDENAAWVGSMLDDRTQSIGFS